jgi:hypothetical protein
MYENARTLLASSGRDLASKERAVDATSRLLYVLHDEAGEMMHELPAQVVSSMHVARTALAIVVGPLRDPQAMEYINDLNLALDLSRNAMRNLHEEQDFLDRFLSTLEGREPISPMWSDEVWSSFA